MRVIGALKEIVGPERVSTEESDRFFYSMVSTPSTYFYQGKPDFVVSPSSTEEVSRLLRLANEEKMPVVPRGAGSYGHGSAIPQQGGMVIDLSFMDRILALDEDNMSILVEGGCSVYKIAGELFKRGLMLPVMPQYGPGPQAGAGIACNAFGNYTNRNGRFGDIVLGLEVVLPTGEVVTLGSGANKDGYGHWHRYTGIPDLIGLFVNSVGAMGIITKVAFRVQKRPEVIGYYAHGWPREDAEGLTRAAVELEKYPIFNYRNYNRWGFFDSERRGILKLPDPIHFIACIEQDATCEEELGIHERNIRRICEKHRGTDLGDLAFRRSGPPHYLLYGGRGLHRSGELRAKIGGSATEFFFLPITKFPEIYDLWESTLKEHGFWNENHVPYWGAWLGWGNMQPGPMFFINGLDPDQRDRAKRWYGAFYPEIIRRGCCMYAKGPLVPGTIYEVQGPAYELTMRIKSLLDPNNIMNPGIL